jgi:hypothetical protein
MISSERQIRSYHHAAHRHLQAGRLRASSRVKRQSGQLGHVAPADGTASVKSKVAASSTKSWRSCTAGSAVASYANSFDKQTSVADRIVRFRGNVDTRERGEFGEANINRYSIPSQRTSSALSYG